MLVSDSTRRWLVLGVALLESPSKENRNRESWSVPFRQRLNFENRIGCLQPPCPSAKVLDAP